MYYLATLNDCGREQASDFGFDIIERIVLDECFKSLRRIPPGLVKEKKFCIYETGPIFYRRRILGIHAAEIYRRYGIYLGHENCVGTVLDGLLLKSVLEKLWMKIYNREDWRCSSRAAMHALFKSVIVYDPYTLRQMLSEKKYGQWDHKNDRLKALQVLGKFIDFLRENNLPGTLVLYSEILCSRWDATGELHFDTGGRVSGYRCFDQEKGFSYLYNPKVEVWQRGY